MTIPKLPLTPITESTFERQGWTKHYVNNMGYETDKESDMYFFSIALPKERDDMYAPRLISNISNNIKTLTELEMSPGSYFVEILDMDGLGLCISEEELELLYNILTGGDIDSDNTE